MGSLLCVSPSDHMRHDTAGNSVSGANLQSQLFSVDYWYLSMSTKKLKQASVVPDAVLSAGGDFI